MLNLLARLGSGFDIVSGGELARVLAAGGDPRKIVFSGVGKTAEEMRQALAAGILCFNVESESELARLEARRGAVRQDRGDEPAREPRRGPAHPSLHRHRVEGEQVRHRLYEDALGALPARARDAPPRRSPASAATSARSSRTSRRSWPRSTACSSWPTGCTSEGIALAHVDIGGGLGIRYRDESPPAVADYARALIEPPRQPRAEAAARARTRAGRAGRAAAHPRRVPQARPRAQFRGGGRRDERPAAAGALRRLARGAAGPRRQRRRPLRHRRPGVRDRRFPRPRPRRWLCAKATCSRS